MADSPPDEHASRRSQLLVGLLAATAAHRLLADDLVWAGFLGATLLILLLPAVAARDPSRMLPPAVTALAVAPGLTRAFGPPWLTTYAIYVGVAAVALAVVVELSLFTDAEMAPWFADAMVVLTTMAAIGAWAVVQFLSDAVLGTDFLGSADAVMWEFVRATAVGIVAAVGFEFYFDLRLPADASASDLSGESSGGESG